jgi:hypothetical protein
VSRIDRRSMLKAMAAGAAGVAASATGIEKAIGADFPAAATLGNPFPTPPSSTRRPSSIRTALAAGAKSLNFMGQEFKPLASTFTYQDGTSVGSIEGVSGAPTASYYRASVNLPDGVIVTQVLFDVIVNDANPANLFFNGFNPETTTFGPILQKVVATQDPAIQTIDMGIPPTTIDAVNLAYALYWFPGTNGATHQLAGARVAWMLQPGLTLFPDPRRIVDGFVTPFTSGVTYGPFDATKKSGGVVASGVPVGAKAAFCAVQSYTKGALTIFPDLTADPGIANFTATTTGPLNLTYMMIPLSAAGKFKIHSYITGNVFVDAWGYLA